jgi:hypothetical protein
MVVFPPNKGQINHGAVLPCYSAGVVSRIARCGTDKCYIVAHREMLQPEFISGQPAD